LECSGHLTQEARLDLRMITGEHHDQKTYQDDDVTGDDDDHQPTRDNLDDGESDECREKKEFVSNRIEVSPQFGSLVRNTGQEAVNSICNSCDHKSNKGPSKMFIDNEDDEEGDQQDSC